MSPPEPVRHCQRAPTPTDHRGWSGDARRERNRFTPGGYSPFPKPRRPRGVAWAMGWKVQKGWVWGWAGSYVLERLVLVGARVGRLLLNRGGGGSGVRVTAHAHGRHDAVHGGVRDGAASADGHPLGNHATQAAHHAAALLLLHHGRRARRRRTRRRGRRRLGARGRSCKGERGGTG